MVSLDTLSAWLSRRLAVNFVSEVWIFGSVMDAGCEPRDIDIFVQYLDEHCKRIPDWKRAIQEEFIEIFPQPLHMLTLTNTECIEEAMFLELLLKKARRIR